MLDTYKFMALIGKRVIHPGGRASTEVLLKGAQITQESSVLDVGWGVDTTAIEIAKRHRATVTAVDIARLMLERAHVNVRAAQVSDRPSAIMGRVAPRPAHVRRMAWLMPRMAKAVPFVGYALVAGNKPAMVA